jgi:glycosyltransferase involved in cell wall biosynthesis
MHNSSSKCSEVLLPIITDLGIDYRCFKQASSLKKMGYKPIILCDKPNTELGSAWDGFTIKVLTRYSHRKSFKIVFFEFSIRLAFHLLFTRSRLWLVEDCPPLLLVSLMGKLRGRKVIFDAHEIFPESAELENRPWTQFFWTLWQNNGIRLVDKVIAVSPDFIDYFRARFPHKEYFYLPNVPYKSSTRAVNHRDGKSKHVLIHLGFLRKECSLKTLINVIVERDEYELIAVGDGQELKPLRDKVKTMGLENRVQLVGKKPFEQLRNYIRQGDIGIYIIHVAMLNTDLTLPNKMFDYINEGLPVLLGRSRAVSNFLKKYPIGIQVDEESEESVLEGLEAIVENYQTLSNNCFKAKDELCWEHFEKGLQDFIQ